MATLGPILPRLPSASELIGSERDCAGRNLVLMVGGDVDSFFDSARKSAEAALSARCAQLAEAWSVERTLLAEAARAGAPMAGAQSAGRIAWLTGALVPAALGRAAGMVGERVVPPVISAVLYVAGAGLGHDRSGALADWLTPFAQRWLGEAEGGGDAEAGAAAGALAGAGLSRCGPSAGGRGS